jgi:hypothetical protein
VQFITRCTKPSQKGSHQPYIHLRLDAYCSEEFIQICKAVAIGFAVMGFIGYFVKLIHIPMYVFHLYHVQSTFAHALRQKQYSCVCFSSLVAGIRLHFRTQWWGIALYDCLGAQHPLHLSSIKFIWLYPPFNWLGETRFCHPSPIISRVSITSILLNAFYPPLLFRGPRFGSIERQWTLDRQSYLIRSLEYRSQCCNHHWK